MAQNVKLPMETETIETETFELKNAINITANHIKTGIKNDLFVDLMDLFNLWWKLHEGARSAQEKNNCLGVLRPSQGQPRGDARMP